MELEAAAEAPLVWLEAARTTGSVLLLSIPFLTPVSPTAAGLLLLLPLLLGLLAPCWFSFRKGAINLFFFFS